MKNLNFSRQVYLLVGLVFLLSAAVAEAAPSLSQTNLTIGVGQTATVTSQVAGSSVSLLVNGNPSVANVQANGTQINVVGNQTGTTTATICYSGTNSDCANLNITVQSSTTNTSNMPLSFSQNDFTLSVGQGTTTVTISGGNGNYSVQGSSNPSVVSTSINGAILSLSGLAAGNDNINVCDSVNNCSVLYVTAVVSPFTFSNPNPSVSVGQSVPVTISGGANYFVTGSSNYDIASYSITNNILTLTGTKVGSAKLTVCSGGGGCSVISLTVTAANTTVTQTVTSTPVNPVVNVPNISSTITTVDSSASNTALLTAIQSMQNQLVQILTQIQTMAATLTQITAGLNLNASTNASTGTGSSVSSITGFLKLGVQNAEVKALQEKLKTLGFYSGDVTGYYGALTETAVKAFQNAHGITPAGYVGPSTRAALNGQ